MLPFLALSPQKRKKERKKERKKTLFFFWHTHNAAPLPLVCGGESMVHCHSSQPSSKAMRPWPLTRFHGRTLSFFHESACGTLAARAHVTLLCAVRLCVCFLRCLLFVWFFGRRPMLLLLLLLEALYSLHALCGDEFGQHVSTCDDFKQGRACTAHHAPSLSSLVITF